MTISDQYVVVRKREEEKEEGFLTANVQDNFVYEGIIKFLPEAPIYMGNDKLNIGDVILFAKYSPDTHEYDDGEKVKFVHKRDILAKLNT